MIQEISTALASATLVAKITKGLYNQEAKIEKNAAIIELHDTVIRLQAEIMEINSLREADLKVHDELKAKLIEYGKWEQESATYELREAGPAVHLYALKASASANEPFHWLCPRCFNDRKKGVMNLDPSDRTFTIFACASYTYKARVTV